MCGAKVDEAVGPRGSREDGDWVAIAGGVQVLLLVVYQSVVLLSYTVASGYCVRLWALTYPGCVPTLRGKAPLSLSCNEAVHTILT